MLRHLHSSRHAAHPGLVHQHVAHQGALRHEGSVADQALQRLLCGGLGGTHSGYAYAGGKDNTCVIKVLNNCANYYGMKKLTWGLYKRDSVLQLLRAGHPSHISSHILIDRRQPGCIVDVLLRLF